MVSRSKPMRPEKPAATMREYQLKSSTRAELGQVRFMCQDAIAVVFAANLRCEPAVVAGRDARYCRKRIF